jgi:metal-sulfur cluster biosynthetic enzyme
LSGYLLEMVEAAIWQQIAEVESVNLKLVWEPPWHPGLMSDEGKAALGWID